MLVICLLHKYKAIKALWWLLWPDVGFTELVRTGRLHVLAGRGASEMSGAVRGVQWGWEDGMIWACLSCDSLFYSSQIDARESLKAQPPVLFCSLFCSLLLPPSPAFSMHLLLFPLYLPKTPLKRRLWVLCFKIAFFFYFYVSYDSPVQISCHMVLFSVYAGLSVDKKWIHI